MGLLVFVLMVLVIIDHLFKYKPQGLVYYKNQHNFSVIVAVDRYTPNIETMMEQSKNTKHQFIFVSINGAIPEDEDTDVSIIQVDADFEREDYLKRIPLLSKAYKEGYKHAEHEFLLFMDDDHMFENPRTIDHMANNLVEHQVYTIKEMLPKRTAKEGYKAFFDLLRDMNLTDEMINYSFFAVKRNTYELTKAHETIFKNVDDFVETLSKKNVNIIHINHDCTILRRKESDIQESYMARWMTDLKVRNDIQGLRRMLLFLFAMHAFYALIAIDIWLNGFSVYFVILVLLVHIGFAVALQRFARHSWLTYVLIPFHMVMFDLFLLAGMLRRVFYRHISRRKKPASEGQLYDDDHHT